MMILKYKKNMNKDNYLKTFKKNFKNMINKKIIDQTVPVLK